MFRVVLRTCLSIWVLHSTPLHAQGSEQAYLVYSDETTAINYEAFIGRVSQEFRSRVHVLGMPDENASVSSVCNDFRPEAELIIIGDEGFLDALSGSCVQPGSRDFVVVPLPADRLNQVYRTQPQGRTYIAMRQSEHDGGSPLDAAAQAILSQTYPDLDDGHIFSDGGLRDGFVGNFCSLCGCCIEK
jgi:hypothetical protein